MPVITEPSRSGFHDLKRVKQLTDGFGIPSVVVINKYDLNERAAAGEIVAIHRQIFQS